MLYQCTLITLTVMGGCFILILNKPCTLLHPSQTQIVKVIWSLTYKISDINIRLFNFFLILWRHKIDIMTLRKYVNLAQAMQCLNSYHKKTNLNLNFPKKSTDLKLLYCFHNHMTVSLKLKTGPFSIPNVPLLQPLLK